MTSMKSATFTIKDILQTEVAPALGCTEPIAIAFAAAAARSLIPEGKPERIEVCVDPNIYKNGAAVAIPGTEGHHGLELAASLGVFGGDPFRRLEVLEPITEETVSQAKQFADSGQVKIHILEDRRGLYIKGSVTVDGNTAECIIEAFHDHIVSLSLNGKNVSDSPLIQDAKTGGGVSIREIESWLKTLSFPQLLELIDGLDDKDFSFIEEGIQFNLRLAEYGLKHGSGLGIGRTLERLVRQRLMKRDMVMAARILTSAASDARMAGVKLPAMSSGGSGNHGLTATLPIYAVKDYLNCDEKTVLKSIGLSHVITAYVKAHTGRLSAVCGCSIAAGAGAAAGVAHLLGGDLNHIAGAILNLTEDLAGVICDGAKAGCSLKLATAAGTAVQSALFSLHGVRVQPTDGIIGISTESTMENIGKLSSQGMLEADRTILRIMLDKKINAFS